MRNVYGDYIRERNRASKFVLRSVLRQQATPTLCAILASAQDRNMPYEDYRCCLSSHLPGGYLENKQTSYAYQKLASPLYFDAKEADASRYRCIVPIIRAILRERERQAAQAYIAEVAVR